MKKEVILSKAAPQPIGPYSQAVKMGNLVFISGTLGIKSASGTLVPDITGQTRQALENLVSVLSAAGLSLENVAKTTVFLKNMDNFAAMNEVYGSYFREKPPARSTVEVARLPRDALVEIECLAVA